jgi:hypothetical protein
MGKSDAPWYRDPHALFARPLEFFPARGMTHAERLNSMARFVAYVSIAIALYRSDASALGIGLAVVVALSVAFGSPVKAKPLRSVTHAREPAKCTLPTADNPFMNVLTSEYNANKAEACETTTDTLALSQRYFDAGLPREISDVYRNRASDRQFVTMPVSGSNGTPDTLAFRNYLFSNESKK